MHHLEIMNDMKSMTLMKKHERRYIVRKESILTITLSLMLASAGGLALNQTISGEMNQEICKKYNNKSIKTSANNINSDYDELANDDFFADSEDRYAYDDTTPFKSKKIIDISASEAQEIIVEQVEKIYGKLNGFYSFGISNRTGDGVINREYYGTFTVTSTEGDGKKTDYEFALNSITGKLIYIYKHCPDLDKRNGDSSSEISVNGDELDNTSEKYEKIAKEFASSYFDDNDIAKMEVIYNVVFYGGENDLDYFHQSPAVELTMDDNSKYTISIHPTTGEIVGFVKN
jgi:hypothetical protein